jgi:glutaredoxin
MEVIIIGKDDCSMCKTAQEFSKVKKVKFTYKKVPDDISLDDARTLAGTMFRQFPAIIVNDVYMPSFSEYQRFIVKNK